MAWELGNSSAVFFKTYGVVRLQAKNLTMVDLFHHSLL
jgi:hypothetical protein